MKNGLLKNKNYKEIHTITDTVIMTEMHEHVILPSLVQKRDVSMKRKSAEFTVPPTRNSRYQSSISSTDDQNDSTISFSDSSSSSSSTSSSSSSVTLVQADLSRIPPPILVYLDGDYPRPYGGKWSTKYF